MCVAFAVALVTFRAVNIQGALPVSLDVHIIVLQLQDCLYCLTVRIADTDTQQPT